MEYSRNTAGILNLANNSGDERCVTVDLQQWGKCLKWYIYVIELNSVLFFIAKRRYTRHWL